MANKNLLFYNPAIISEDEGGVTIADVKAARAALSERHEHGFLLRATTAFVGSVEGGPDDVGLVAILGDDPEDRYCAAVRQAFEEAGVEVIVHDLHEAEEQGEAQSLEEPAGLSELKARATALGIHFASNIGEAALRARVDKAEAEAAAVAAAAVAAAAAKAEDTANG